MPASQDPPTIILLAGPTAVGKTAVSLELARRLGTEIVNADSMQVYRHMDIGTAKPTREERSLIRHHLLDVVDPDEPFDAARYAKLARSAIDRILADGKTPLVVGGTGLYLKVLTRGICPAPPSDPAVREELLREEQRVGLGGLHRALREADPQLGEIIHPHDRQRILRALEVLRATGRPLSRWQAEHRFHEEAYRTVKIFLHRERSVLRERIDRRVHEMLEMGLVEEVRGLLDSGYSPGLKPMQSLGYRQMTAHLQGAMSFTEAVEEMQRETCRYAKRQVTWFRGDPEFHWMSPEDLSGIMAVIDRAGIGR